ncbi:hypothetical protein PPERSA_07237 [Pseudocohnilembus persalinus]|uniref:Uncharacterized protein n=1 Tax=Pseudocohnilembus persalinus TaxID=266149 RepID=A0A0V0QD40_PSEPJ|nr:hypothetical protein PPERSA_07237 [Pseudocohnilembus persalinus]|eukprot:KRX00040.1 hypothetical protein PPERSA_07237 [Pseudocohnilembus persalinus]
MQNSYQNYNSQNEISKKSSVQGHFTNQSAIISSDEDDENYEKKDQNVKVLDQQQNQEQNRISQNNSNSQIQFKSAILISSDDENEDIMFESTLQKKKKKEDEQKNDKIYQNLADQQENKKQNKMSEKFKDLDNSINFNNSILENTEKVEEVQINFQNENKNQNQKLVQNENLDYLEQDDQKQQDIDNINNKKKKYQYIDQNLDKSQFYSEFNKKAQKDLEIRGNQDSSYFFKKVNQKQKQNYNQIIDEDDFDFQQCDEKIQNQNQIQQENRDKQLLTQNQNKDFDVSYFLEENGDNFQYQNQDFQFWKNSQLREIFENVSDYLKGFGFGKVLEFYSQELEKQFQKLENVLVVSGVQEFKQEKSELKDLIQVKGFQRKLKFLSKDRFLFKNQRILKEAVGKVGQAFQKVQELTFQKKFNLMLCYYDDYCENEEKFSFKSGKEFYEIYFEFYLIFNIENISEDEQVLIEDFESLQFVIEDNLRGKMRFQYSDNKIQLENYEQFYIFGRKQKEINEFFHIIYEKQKKNSRKVDQNRDRDKKLGKKGCQVELILEEKCFWVKNIWNQEEGMELKNKVFDLVFKNYKLDSGVQVKLMLVDKHFQRFFKKLMKMKKLENFQRNLFEIFQGINQNQKNFYVFLRDVTILDEDYQQSYVNIEVQIFREIGENLAEKKLLMINRENQVLRVKGDICHFQQYFAQQDILEQLKVFEQNQELFQVILDEENELKSDIFFKKFRQIKERINSNSKIWNQIDIYCIQNYEYEWFYQIKFDRGNVLDEEENSEFQNENMSKICAFNESTNKKLNLFYGLYKKGIQEFGRDGFIQGQFYINLQEDERKHDEEGFVYNQKIMVDFNNYTLKQLFDIGKNDVLYKSVGYNFNLILKEKQLKGGVQIDDQQKQKQKYKQKNILAVLGIFNQENEKKVLQVEINQILRHFWQENEKIEQEQAYQENLNYQLQKSYIIELDDQDRWFEKIEKMVEGQVNYTQNKNNNNKNNNENNKNNDNNKNNIKNSNYDDNSQLEFENEESLSLIDQQQIQILKGFVTVDKVEMIFNYFIFEDYKYNREKMKRIQNIQKGQQVINEGLKINQIEEKFLFLINPGFELKKLVDIYEFEQFKDIQEKNQFQVIFEEKVFLCDNFQFASQFKLDNKEQILLVQALIQIEQFQKMEMKLEFENENEKKDENLNIEQQTKILEKIGEFYQNEIQKQKKKLNKGMIKLEYIGNMDIYCRIYVFEKSSFKYINPKFIISYQNQKLEL